jgi:hypothetical protein
MSFCSPYAQAAFVIDGTSWAPPGRDWHPHQALQHPQRDLAGIALMAAGAASRSMQYQWRTSSSRQPSSGPVEFMYTSGDPALEAHRPGEQARTQGANGSSFRSWGCRRFRQALVSVAGWET